MAEKQKLIELLVDVPVNYELCMRIMGQCPTIETPCYECLADYLLANGVTFATDTNVGGKWKPASEPPEVWRDKNGTMVNYLIYMPEYGVDVGNYVEPAKRWLCVGLPVEVTHWMPLPEPPKEGR